ncbi:MAG TPA: cyclase family protein, partial [Microbacterium sp.]|nr:cyclase family protein [Microbacterium sp.]
MTTPSDNPADLDRTDPEAEISARAEAYRNWGRWGQDDVLGTLNFIEPAQRIAAAGLVREGRVISLAQSFDTNGPQKGWRRRTNPVHTMTDTGTDAERGNQGFPHGIGGADDVISMPLQCSTQWDGLGHIFDHGNAWNGRRAGDVVTSEGDLVTGIEHAAAVIVSRGVLLDVGRHLQPETGELADGYAITAANLDATAGAQGVAVRRGDIVLVRTGQLTRARRDGWGDYAGGPAPGLSLTTAGWLHRTEIAAIATDTWGFEVRPNEFDVPAFQPLHQVVIPNLGLTIGE